MTWSRLDETDGNLDKTLFLSTEQPVMVTMLFMSAKQTILAALLRTRNSNRPSEWILTLEHVPPQMHVSYP